MGGDTLCMMASYEIGGSEVVGALSEFFSVDR